MPVDIDKLSEELYPVNIFKPLIDAPEDKFIKYEFYQIETYESIVWRIYCCKYLDAFKKEMANVRKKES